MNHPNSSQLSAVQATFSRLIPSLPHAMAAILAICSSSLIRCLPASAQLPPVNMGRWVKQPGDNQYSSDTQQSRHGGGQPAYQVVPQQQAVMQQQQAPVWRPTPKVFRSDISVEPIVCDEPIAPVGFAPLPESLDLPGLRGGSGFVGGSRGGMGGMGGMGGGGAAGFSSSYQGSAPGMGGGGPARPPESHQGYTTHEPGSFVKRKTPYGNGNVSGATGGASDVYSSGDGASSGPPMSDAQRALRGYGKEPSLNKGGSPAPEAPVAMQVNQATTQDLSLPDDDAKNNNNQRKSSSQAGKMVKNRIRQVGRQMMRPLNQMPLPMPRFH